MTAAAEAAAPTFPSPLAFGSPLPDFVGATVSGQFWSKDAQAGRPALLVTLGAAGEASERLRALLAQAGAFAAAGVDIWPLAPMDTAALQLVSADPALRDRLLIVTDGAALAQFSLGRQPAAVSVDRAGRIVDIAPLDQGWDAAAALSRIKAHDWSAPAPALVAPNLMTGALCQALIELFERSDHAPGAMAAVAGGRAVDKLDASQKSRRDFELIPGAPLHAEVMAVLAGGCAPAIKRAFQKDVGYVDRILIARYEVGDQFGRHRDNLLPHTAHREFAVTLNLNTDDYDGGDLTFPEFSPAPVRPPSGGAAIFSASLLHEVTPVTRGRRYCALTFLSGRAE